MWFDTAAISFFIVSIPIKYVAAWIWVHPRWIHGVTPTAFSAAAAARCRSGTLTLDHMCLDAFDLTSDNAWPGTQRNRLRTSNNMAAAGGSNVHEHAA